MERGSIFSEHVFIPFEGGHLEGWLSYDAEETSCHGILLLPPHPSFAGSMENNVVRELATTLSESGFVVLRFNYPGIGASHIEIPGGMSALDYWNAVEKEQRFDEALRPALTALHFLHQSLGEFIDRIHLVGYSYGAMIALMMARGMSDLHSISAVSLPWVSQYQYGFLREIRCKKLFITGKQDFAFDPSVYEKAWPHVSEPKRVKWLDCDHFFRKQEQQLALEVRGFLLEVSNEDP